MGVIIKSNRIRVAILGIFYIIIYIINFIFNTYLILEAIYFRSWIHKNWNQIIHLSSMIFTYFFLHGICTMMKSHFVFFEGFPCLGSLFILKNILILIWYLISCGVILALVILYNCILLHHLIYYTIHESTKIREYH